MTTNAQTERVPGMGEITRLLQQMREGDPKATQLVLNGLLLPLFIANFRAARAKAQPKTNTAVKLLFFVGLTHQQAAKGLGVSVSTVERPWVGPHAWLFRESQPGPKCQDVNFRGTLEGINRDLAQE